MITQIDRNIKSSITISKDIFQVLRHMFASECDYILLDEQDIEALGKLYKENQNEDYKKIIELIKRYNERFHSFIIILVSGSVLIYHNIMIQRKEQISIELINANR